MNTFNNLPKKRTYSQSLITDFYDVFETKRFKPSNIVTCFDNKISNKETNFSIDKFLIKFLIQEKFILRLKKKTIISLIILRMKK